jgi:hypothetical protein
MLGPPLLDIFNHKQPEASYFRMGSESQLGSENREKGAMLAEGKNGDEDNSFSNRCVRAGASRSS